MELSCAFATAMDTPQHVAVAEGLGYRRAWCYDSPAVLADVWMILGLAAERTSTIGLGPGVIVPSLRHPMVTAAATATLAELAPGRVALAVGSGFTGRLALGQRPMRWDDVAAYVTAVRALLRGEDATWEGQVLRMLHPEGCGATRPVDVPVLIGADGPRGQRVARELGDGIFSATFAVLRDSDEDSRAFLMWGSVLADDEQPDSNRTVAAMAPAVAVLYHVSYERGGPAAVDALPGGRRWREAVEQVPAPQRQLAVHAGHQVALNAADRVVATEATALIPTVTETATVEELRRRLGVWSEAGVTEVAYQPGGPDIPRELETFARMAQDLG